MFKGLASRYYTFFDETISSSTFTVLLITCLIFAAGSITTHAKGDDYKGSIIDITNQKDFTNIVVIDGTKYELKFTKKFQ